ncbi:DUF1236 domain-containing protein [Prosthecodimorpha staleyi]|uniref:DUF1236 domain-containing protein n=1 Tax=Prosthecodimorpha staleyi TaxID=2840188 RepID=A0A947D163_9HYPH|nr:DUF1236 domain-containing protein [Prosthecodimorpha staleyi]MBT9288444.1 DUF1236 domain-containing protein [Prosthecodimorpha staleyi]
MLRSVLALTAGLALTSAASAADTYYGEPDGGDYTEQTWRSPVPPRGIGPDFEAQVVVRRPPPPPRLYDPGRGGVVVHERTVTERTIVPARPDGWRERADWRDDEDDGLQRRRPTWTGSPVGYDPSPVMLDRPVMVGTVLPHTVMLTPVPPRYGYAGYSWVADPHGRRLLVEPHSRRVVRIVDRW